MRRLCIVLAAVAALVLTAATARAAPSATATTVTPVAGRFPCDGFEALETATLVSRTTTFVDAAGAPVRAHIHNRYTGTLTNSVTGKTLTDAPDPSNVFLD